MKQNVGTTDKVIRIVIAIVIFVIGIVFRSWWGLLGFFPLITAIIGWCPGYWLLNISTISKEKPKKST
ncbi:MAG: DUF2892 domain-containing protein [Bacteroidota bacterium]|nr:DUF2892 domain-containing protein [Bacteroidota bacterium]